MDEDVKKFRKRRDERIKAKRADEDWITIRGTHVLIDDDGQVSKGPDTLKNVISNSGGYKSRAERKYGSNAKYAKALQGGWSVSTNRPTNVAGPSNRPGALREIDKYSKAGLGGTGAKYDPKSGESYAEWKKRGGPSLGKPLTNREASEISHGAETLGTRAEEARQKMMDRLTESSAPKMEDDFKSEGYKKNKEGRWEKTGKAKPTKIESDDPLEGYSFKSGGKTWDMGSLTKLWKDRGYGERTAKAKAKKDLKENYEAKQTNPEESAPRRLKSGRRSAKETAGSISTADLRKEVKKLIDEKGIDGLKNQDFNDLKKKYGIDITDWQNAVGYYRYGKGGGKEAARRKKELEESAAKRRVGMYD